jgi:hypothetical protein
MRGDARVVRAQGSTCPHPKRAAPITSMVCVRAGTITNKVFVEFHAALWSGALRCEGHLRVQRPRTPPPRQAPAALGSIHTLQDLPHLPLVETTPYTRPARADSSITLATAAGSLMPRRRRPPTPHCLPHRGSCRITARTARPAPHPQPSHEHRHQQEHTASGRDLHCLELCPALSMHCQHNIDNLNRTWPKRAPCTVNNPAPVAAPPAYK